MQLKKSILFLTGTRADFGKIKALLAAVDACEDVDYGIFVTGMHMLERYGATYKEVVKSGFSNIFPFVNQHRSEPMEAVLANTVAGLSRYVHEMQPQMIVVHGDRVETLAGAIVGAMTNRLVAHIEGGELSGTIDELIRHAVSKLSHIHFVANDEAKVRLVQMGEIADTVFVIGSPDVDAMKSKTLPSIAEAKSRYGISFGSYSIAMFHPVTTEHEFMATYARHFVDALLAADEDFIVVLPNNDLGCDFIFEEYKRLEGNPKFVIRPSFRFEHFLTLLKNAKLIVGNSSAGIREAPYYGIPTVNVGTRQRNRFFHSSIISTGYAVSEILSGIQRASLLDASPAFEHFGSGDSAKKFIEIITAEQTWRTDRQKQFVSLSAV